MDVTEVSEDSLGRSVAINTATGEAVREAVHQSRRTIADVADAAGMSRRSLHRKLGGHRAWTVPEIVSIAHVLDVDPASLVRYPEAA